MASPVEAISLYLRFVRARIRAQLQYPTSLALELLGMAGGTFVDFLAILIIFANIPQLSGWSVAEVALLYGIATLAFSFTDLVLGHTDWQLGEIIRTGAFDLMLVRPRPALFQLVCADLQLRRLGKTLQGLAVLVLALAQLRIDWSLDRLLVLLLAPLVGALIFSAIWIVTICSAFWTIEGREAANAFTYGGQSLSQYPINIYERWLRNFLAFVVPTAFVAYFPTLYILGKPDPLGLPAALQLASPLVAVATLAVALWLWGRAVRHYRSAGG